MTAEQAAYAAQVSFPSLVSSTTSSVVKYNWSVQQTGASQSALAFNPADTSVFLAGTVGPNLVIRLDTPIASVLLAKPGAAFTISLAVASSFGSGTAAAILAMPAPPSGGICRVSPQTGVPLKTQFVVHCKDWSCDTLPLSYSFSTRSLEIAVASDPAVSWSSPTAATTYELYLTAGNFLIAVAVRNNAGLATISDISDPVRVKALPSTNGGQNGSLEVDLTVMSGLTDGLVQRGRVGIAVEVFDGVAGSVNADSPAFSATCSAKGGCRRLLSSAAYRLAVRLLLFNKLAGVNLGASAGRLSPAVLRASRRAAGISKELDAYAVDRAVEGLISVLRALTLRSMRTSGVFLDAVILAASVLAASQPEDDAGSRSAVMSQVVGALEGSGRSYVRSMVEGESPASLSSGTGLLFYMARDPAGPGVAVQSSANSLHQLSRTVKATRQATSTLQPAQSLTGIVTIRVGAALGFPTAFDDTRIASASSQVRIESVCFHIQARS